MVSCKIWKIHDQDLYNYFSRGRLREVAKKKKTNENFKLVALKVVGVS